MTMQDKSLYGFEIKEALGGMVEMLSVDQTENLRGPTLAVCNTSPQNTVGTHWIVICIDKHQRGEFFDSFGLHPASYDMEASMRGTQSWVYNDVSLQEYGSSVCGYYAIGYSLAKINGISMAEFVGMFSSDNLNNDRQIYSYVEHLL